MRVGPQQERMLACEEVIQQLWDYLDGELTADRMAAIREHLSQCTRCLPQHDFQREFLRAVQAVRHDHTPIPHQRERVMAVLRANGLPRSEAK